jgi:hypothetical protein
MSDPTVMRGNNFKDDGRMFDVPLVNCLCQSTRQMCHCRCIQLKCSLTYWEINTPLSWLVNAEYQRWYASISACSQCSYHDFFNLLRVFGVQMIKIASITHGANWARSTNQNVSCGLPTTCVNPIGTNRAGSNMMSTDRGHPDRHDGRYRSCLC